jgi:hypothetical protein
MHLTIVLLTSLLAAKPSPPPAPGHLLAAAPAKAAAAPAASAPAGDDAAPAKPSPPSAGSAPAASIDVARLRAEYDRLRDALFRSRARAELVEEGVYASKLGARIRWKGAPDFIMRRAEVLLDGNSIWDSGEKPMVDEMIKVSERPIKPGTHSVAIRLEIRPGKKSEKEHEGLGYELEHTFVVNVPDGKRTTIDITADDDGDLPEYEPEIEVEVESEK